MNVSEIVGRHGNNRENLLQILHALQDASGDNSLHRDALEELAKIMDIELTISNKELIFVAMSILLRHKNTSPLFLLLLRTRR